MQSCLDQEGCPSRLALEVAASQLAAGSQEALQEDSSAVPQEASRPFPRSAALVWRGR